MRTEVVRSVTETSAPTVVSSRRMQKVYPLGIQRTPSVASISPLSLSHNSSDSSLTGTTTSTWERKVSLSFHGLFGSLGRRPIGSRRREFRYRQDHADDDDDDGDGEEDAKMRTNEDGNLKRCSWITNFSEENYVKFHDECWGVPVYDDSKLFELLSLSGMLIDHNWSVITKKREQYRQVFGNFEPTFVAQMEERDIVEIGWKKELMLAESRVRSIVHNARCTNKVVEEYGTFGCYLWSQVKYRPTINRHKHGKSVPMRSPRSEVISKELLRRGFTLVGPVIVYSFMQAAGLVVDHLVGCFRYPHCTRIAQRWPPAGRPAANHSNAVLL